MFLRNLISTSLIMSVSVGSSIAVGAAYSKDVLRVNIEEAEQGIYDVIMPQAPTHRSTPSSEELHAKLLKASEYSWSDKLSIYNFLMQMFIANNPDLQELKPSALLVVSLEEKVNRKAQKAENKAQQATQRKALRRVEKSFKPSVKSRFQHR